MPVFFHFFFFPTATLIGHGLLLLLLLLALANVFFILVKFGIRFLRGLQRGQLIVLLGVYIDL